MVWLVNGLICKVLNLVPRHKEIVARISGENYAELLTLLIGIAELFMAFWVMSRYKSRLSTILQVVVVMTMNILEFVLVNDLLLWGKWNIFFAFLFVLMVLYNEFILARKMNGQHVR